MVREFKFFKGYVDDISIEIDWNNINRINDINRLTVTPGYGTITIPNYYPNHFIGDYPLTGTSTGLSLITSNSNGFTSTTTGMVGAFTTTGTISTNTFYNSNIK